MGTEMTNYCAHQYQHYFGLNLKSLAQKLTESHYVTCYDLEAHLRSVFKRSQQTLPAYGGGFYLPI